ncbi:unnamed protein product, partial [marine sediment metagenome]
INSPKNTVEANISVDSSVAELIRLRDIKEANQNFSRDDYLAYAEMHEINQFGKALVGIFANALKAYQVTYDTLKNDLATQGASKARQEELLAGLTSDFNTQWIQFAGLINAATDNAKLQILGTLGIGPHNANLVSYMVATGISFEQIVDYLDANEAEMIQLRNSDRHDDTNFFDPAKAWGATNPDLAALYSKAEEYALLATSLSINRDLPNSTWEMFHYKNRLEKHVNDAFKEAKVNSKFDLMQFINNDDTASRQVVHYKQVTKLDNHHFNILKILKDSTHVRDYSKLYATSYGAVNRLSNVTRVANEIADGQKKSVDENSYRDITEFTYGLAIAEYLKGQKTPSGMDLGTLEGRNDFVDYMGNVFIDYAKGAFPDNSFIQTGLSVEPSEKYNYEDSPAPQLRTHELMDMDEDKLIVL